MTGVGWEKGTLMRWVSVIALVAGCGFMAATVHEAEAQARRDQRPRVIIQKRSYLNPGNEIKPQSKDYQDHAFPIASRYPRYGDDPNGFNRGPLPREFEIPGY
jgi:hypothetical protein